MVEGKVLSVRQAGAVTYLNFGTELRLQDFAATISRPHDPGVIDDAHGLSPKSLENSEDSPRPRHGIVAERTTDRGGRGAGADRNARREKIK